MFTSQVIFNDVFKAALCWPFVQAPFRVFRCRMTVRTPCDFSSAPCALWCMISQASTGRSDVVLRVQAMSAISRSALKGRIIMLDRGFFRASAIVLASSWVMASVNFAAAADAKYPSWKGQWVPVTAQGAGRSTAFDPTKPEGPAQQAPLTPEYQKVLNDSVADLARGGFGHDPTALCYAAGMPRMMTYEAQEYVITPDVTYIMLGGDDHL